MTITNLNDCTARSMAFCRDGSPWHCLVAAFWRVLMWSCGFPVNNNKQHVEYYWPLLCCLNSSLLCDLGPICQRSRIVFAPRKPWQNCKPYDYRTVFLHTTCKLHYCILHILRSSLPKQEVSNIIIHLSVFRYDCRY